MKKFVDTVDRIPPVVLLAVTGAAGFTAAVVQVLVVTIGEFPSTVTRDLWPLIVVFVMAGGVVAFDAVIGLLWRRAISAALAVQACAVAVVTGALIIWAGSIVVMGTPRDIGFAWTPGFLAAVGCYSVYLLRRTLFSSSLSRPAVYYSHLWTFAAILPLEVGVSARAMFDFMTRH